MLSIFFESCTNAIFKYKNNRVNNDRNLYSFSIFRKRKYKVGKFKIWCNFIFIFRTFSTIHFHTYPELHRAHLCFKKIGTRPNRLSDWFCLFEQLQSLGKENNFFAPFFCNQAKLTHLCPSNSDLAILNHSLTQVLTYTWLHTQRYYGNS